MRIKLLNNIPVEDKHGMLKGKEFKVVKIELAEFLQKDRTINHNCFDFWVVGEEHEPVKIWSREAEIIDEEITEFLLDNGYKQQIEMDIDNRKELSKKNQEINKLLCEIADLKEKYGLDVIDMPPKKFNMLNRLEKSTLIFGNMLASTGGFKQPVEEKKKLSEKELLLVDALEQREMPKSKKYKLLTDVWIEKYKNPSSFNKVTGFILNTGHIINVGFQAHVSMYMDFEDYVGLEQEKLTKRFGAIRLRNEGVKEVNIEIFKKPTYMQIKSLQRLEDDSTIYYDFWGEGDSEHSPYKGTDKKDFFKSLNEFWK